MKLSKLVATKGFYLDESDIATYGHLSAYVDDQFRITVNLGSRKLGKSKLHRLVMDAKEGEVVDHINGNPSDNRKANLRITTLSCNQANRKINCNNTSGYKGVRYHTLAKRFVARIMVDSKENYLGLYDTAIEAALAYNKAAIKYFGPFAKLNNLGVDDETV